MPAIIILFFPAIVMVMYYHWLTGKNTNYKHGCIEYIGALLLINCILMSVSYVVGGSTNSIVYNLNSYSGYASKYLIFALILAVGIPWVCNDICKHGMQQISSVALSENNYQAVEGKNKLYSWISEQWTENGCFSCFIPVLTAIACFFCALFFTKSVDINNTGIIILWICILAVGSLYLKFTKRNISIKLIIVLLFITGFLLRLNYVLYTGVNVRQHDVGTFFADDGGHAAYIEWFFKKWFTLPENPTYGQFYHPPLHHFLAAVWMHIFTHFFSFSAENAVTCIPFLTLFYSSYSMIIAERILSALGIHKSGKVIAFSLVVFHPTFIILAGSINNDMLSVLLTLLTIYTTIRWYQQPTLKKIVLIALSIGCGMMTKLTVAVVAPSVAVVFLIKLIQACKQRQGIDYLGKYCAFGCVCIPLGMWYPIWKLIYYNIPLNYVMKLPLDSDQYVGYHSIYERLLDFSYFPFQIPYDSWSEYKEYNPLVAIAKVSMFGEYGWGANRTLLFSSRLLLYVNILLIILSILSMLFVIGKRNRIFDRNLKIFMISYHVILFIYFIVFCFQYPHTCSMDYRYIVPTCVLGAVYIGYMFDYIDENNGRWSNISKVVRCFTICGTAVFCILVSVIYVVSGIS